MTTVAADHAYGQMGRGTSRLSAGDRKMHWQGCLTKQQVRAGNWSQLADYNRNRKDARPASVPDRVIGDG